MLDNNLNTDTHKLNDEIDLKELFGVLWGKKFMIISITSLFALMSVLYALWLPNFYHSSAVLLPSSSNDSLSSKLSSFSGLAGLAGVDLPAGEASKSQEAVKRIKSLEFFSNFFLPEVKMEDIIAVDRWLPQNNVLIYDSKLFDKKNNKWVREVSYPYKTIPSNQEAFLEYKEKILTISEDQLTSFVTITIRHQSPFIAKEWLDIIIRNINSSMRLEDEIIAKNSIKYLNDYYKTTNIQSLRESISSLQESQMQTLMIASSTDDYIFKTIDSPAVPELKSGPRRSIISIIGTLLGAIISILIALVRHYLVYPSKN
tara:strand:+ start:55 stop:999 length:945 start_codon:yes stop_codon:yes gene_type:complete